MRRYSSKVMSDDHVPMGQALTRSSHHERVLSDHILNDGATNRTVTYLEPIHFIQTQIDTYDSAVDLHSVKPGRGEISYLTIV